MENMNLSAFSDDNFEVEDWINKTFASAESQENKEAFVCSLVTKLQIYVQQMNNALEETSQQVLQSLPRVIRDTEILQQEAVLLKEKMQSVKEEISKVEKDTGQSMATLEQIDRIKSHLQNAKQALHEADNWTILSADLEEVFESGDIKSIAAKLVSLQQSLLVLVNVPDFEERKFQLEGHKNRLEAVSSPHLVQAFTSGNVEKSKMFVDLFTSINRLPELVKYYHKCQKGAMLQQWRKSVEMEQDEGPSVTMQQFYDSLLSNWDKQIKWCSQVFPTEPAVEILVSLYTDVLTALDPSLNSYIDSFLKEQQDELLFLLELRQNTKNFSSSLQVALESCDSDKSLGEEMLLGLAEAIHNPYIPFIAKYVVYEQPCLVLHLSTIESKECDDLMEAVQNLGLSLPKVMLGISESKKRCFQFTEGCGFCGFVKAIKVYLNSCLEWFKSLYLRIKQLKNEGEDLTKFQICLTLLQNAGEFLFQLRQLNSELVVTLLDMSRDFSTNESKRNIFLMHRKLLLTTSGRKEFAEMIANIQNGQDSVLVLDPVVSDIQQVCKDIYSTTFQVIFSQILAQLDLVQSAPAWSEQRSHSLALTQDLPDYSFAPQEYITQVGQYLMTLPQHLEPFLLQDNPSLKTALCAADSEYDDVIGSSESEGRFAHILLGAVSKATCQKFCDNILGIHHLSPNACKQLATDINYLGNVLEDLGLSLTSHLQQVLTLLKLSQEDYLSKSVGCTPYLVAAVRQMRNITTS